LKASLFFILISFLSFGCTGNKSATSTKTPPEVLPTPPIYPNISAFEKPPCSTPDLRIKEGSLCGSVIGTSAGEDVNAYLGIPFAESTGGRNRWRPPVPKAPWNGTLRATRMGPSCPQVTKAMNPQSEDCLSVNVWTPAEDSVSPRAVMVFIYGGAFIFGSNADPRYDGATQPPTGTSSL